MNLYPKTVLSEIAFFWTLLFMETYYIFIRLKTQIGRNERREKSVSVTKILSWMDTSCYKLIVQAVRVSIETG